jgi:hypothetical protein
MEFGPMAITIRNKTTEDLIHKIGRRTGEGPSAVIRRLAEREAGTHGAQDPVPPEVVEARMRNMEELRLKYTHPDDPKLTWQEIEEEMDAIFGDHLS